MRWRRRSMGPSKTSSFTSYAIAVTLTKACRFIYLSTLRRRRSRQRSARAPRPRGFTPGALGRGQQARPVPHGGHRVLGDDRGLLRSTPQELVGLVGVGHESLVALPDGA